MESSRPSFPYSLSLNVSMRRDHVTKEGFRAALRGGKSSPPKKFSTTHGNTILSLLAKKKKFTPHTLTLYWLRIKGWEAFSCLFVGNGIAGISLDTSRKRGMNPSRLWRLFDVVTDSPRFIFPSFSPISELFVCRSNDTLCTVTYLALRKGIE